MSTSIRLKNSSALVGGKAKAPMPADLAQGELAVNINKDDPSLFVKDSDGVVRKIAGSDATGVQGEYLSLAADAEAQTVATSETTTFTGQVDLPGGGNDTQALQKQEVEALIDASDTGAGKYVEKAGDTMTGQLTLAGGGGDTQALQKQEVEALIADPDGPADGNYLKLAADAGDQTVQSTGTTTFNGSSRFNDTIAVTRGAGAISDQSQYFTMIENANGHYFEGRSGYTNPKGFVFDNKTQQLTDPTIQAPAANTPRELRTESVLRITQSLQNKESVDGGYGGELEFASQLPWCRQHGDTSRNVGFVINRAGNALFQPVVDQPASAGQHITLRVNPDYKYSSKASVFGLYLDANKDANDYQSNPLTIDHSSAIYIRNSWGSLSNVSNYGIHSHINVKSGADNFNIFASGSAPNLFGGNTYFGQALASADDFPGNTVVGAKFIGTNADGANAPLEILSRNSSNTVGRSLIAFSQYDPADGSTENIGYIKAQNSRAGVIYATDSDGTAAFVELGDARNRTFTDFSGNAADTIKLLQPKVNGFNPSQLQTVVASAVIGTENEEQAIGTLYDFDGTVLETEVTEPSAEELTYTEEVVDETQPTIEGQEPRMVEVTRTRTWTPTGTRPVYQGVDQTKLIPLLTKALQEALERIEQLEAQLGAGGGSDFESRVAALETDMARFKAI